MQRLAYNPLAALIASLLVGLLFGEVVLAVSSCILGMVAGGLHTPSQAELEPNEQAQPQAQPKLGSSQQAEVGKPHSPPSVKAHNTAAASLTSDDQACVAAAAEEPVASREPASNARAGVSVDERVHLEAVRSAEEALRLMEQALADPEASGWKLHSTREEVQILTQVRPTGVTWCMSMGKVDSPVGVVLGVMENDSLKRQVDKHFDRSTKLHVVPPTMLRVGGWQTISIEVVQTLLRRGSSACPPSAKPEPQLA